MLLLGLFFEPLVKFSVYLASSLHDCIYKFFALLLALWIRGFLGGWRGRGVLLNEFTVFCHGCIVAREIRSGNCKDRRFFAITT